MLAPSDPIAAVTHPDPYPYYANLVAERPLYRDASLGLWVAAGAAAVTSVLKSEAGRVRPPAEPVPRALVGTPAGEIFRHLVRMNDGANHLRLKPGVSAKGPPVGTMTVGALAASRLARVSQSAMATQSVRLPPIWMTQAPDLTTGAVSVELKTESMAEIRSGERS